MRQVQLPLQEHRSGQIKALGDRDCFVKCSLIEKMLLYVVFEYLHLRSMM